MEPKITPRLNHAFPLRIANVFGGLFFDTTDRSKLLKAGDVPADFGDTLTKWISRDGTHTIDAVGSPTLVAVEGQPHPGVDLDGSSGFIKVFDPGENPVNADPVAGAAGIVFQRKAISVNPNVLLVSAATNTTAGGRLAFSARQNATTRNTGISAIQTGAAGSLRTFSEGDAAGRLNAVSRAVWQSTDTAYTFRGANGESTISGNTDGLWFTSTGGAFDMRNFSIGFMRNSAGDTQHFTGRIFAAGYFDDQMSAAAIENALNLMYPVRSVLMIGDSRSNSDDLFVALDADTPGHNFRELATGGHTAALCEADLVTHAGQADRRYTDFVVLVGINETAFGGVPSDVMSDTISLVDKIDELYPNSRIHLCNEIPSGSSSLMTAPEIENHRTFSGLIDDFAATRPNVQSVDTYGGMEDPSNADQMRPADTTDGIHLTASGYERLVDTLLATI